MKNETLTPAEIVTVLHEQLKKAGTYKQLGDLYGCQATYMHDVLNGRRLPGKRILDKMKLRRERITVYRRVA